MSSKILSDFKLEGRGFGIPPDLRISYSNFKIVSGNPSGQEVPAVLSHIILEFPIPVYVVGTETVRVHHTGSRSSKDETRRKR